jgi:hypothetical protein
MEQYITMAQKNFENTEFHRLRISHARLIKELITELNKLLDKQKPQQTQEEKILAAQK